MRLFSLFSLSSLLLFHLVGCGQSIRPHRPEIANATTWSPNILEKRWDAFLKKHVNSEGLVDYETFHNNPDELIGIYAELAKFSPDSHPERFTSEEERFAYWLNAYNIAVVRGVCEHYPIASVLEVKPPSPFSLIEKGGFFVGQRFIIGSENVHLYRLENGIIRKRFPDPRLHFALNCASGGCPPLSRESFQATRLEEQLERQTRKFINSSQAYQIDKRNKQILLSRIFDWYRKDFTQHLPTRENTEATVFDYIENYLEPHRLTAFQKARKQGYDEDWLDYDWSLNDSRPVTSP